MKLFRRRRKPYPRALRLTWLWLLVLVAVSPWLLGICLAAVVLGAALFAVARPGQRTQVYYQRLGLIALGLASFVDLMLLLGRAA